MPRYIAKTRRQTLSQISIPYNLQKGKCAICGAKVPIAGKARAYDKETTRILCKRCSTVLGMVNRSPQLLDRLIAYIAENAR